MNQGMTAKQKEQLRLAAAKDRPAMRAKFQRDNANARKERAANNRQATQTQPPKPPNRLEANKPKLDYFDAFKVAPECACLGMSVGPATCIHGSTVSTVNGTGNVAGTYTYLNAVGTSLTANVSTNRKLVIMNPGSSDNVMGIVIGFVEAAGVVSCVIEDLLTAKQFAGVTGPTQKHPNHPLDNLGGNDQAISQDPAGRVESIPLRGSIRIKNVTEHVAVGGSVRVLRYSGGIRYWADPAGAAYQSDSSNFGTPDVKAVLDLCEMVVSSDRASHYGGKELLARHQINSHPADFVRSHTFLEDTHFDEAILHPKFSTVLILIDNFVASSNQLGNTYEMSVHVHRAARFTPGSLLHGKAQDLHGDAHTHNAETSKEAASGSNLKVVNEGAVASVGSG